MSDVKSFNMTLNNFKNQRTLPFLSIGILNLQHFFQTKNIFFKFFVAFFLSILMGFVNFFLIERTGIYTPGIAALYQSWARLAKYTTKNIFDPKTQKMLYLMLFWGLNIFSNVICACFCFKNIGKMFTILTVTYICGISLTGLTLSNMPESFGIKDFYIFSNPKDSYQELTEANIDFLSWPLSEKTHNNHGKIFILFIYGFFYAIFNTFVSLIIYSLGASTGGIDWIIFYLYKTKSYSSSKLLFYSGFVIVFSAYFFGTYIPYYNKEVNRSWKILIPNLISPILLSTIIAIFIKKILFNFFYPQFKFIKVEVFTNKFMDIRKELMNHKFPHSFTIVNTIGSYLLRTQTQLEFICFSIELPILTEIVRKVDASCLIVATPIKSLSGHITLNTDSIK